MTGLWRIICLETDLISKLQTLSNKQKYVSELAVNVYVTEREVSEILTNDQQHEFY